MQLLPLHCCTELCCSLATHFDVAVVRCLFVSKWSEPGIFWAVTYLHRRLKGLHYTGQGQAGPRPRKRSNSLPVPKIEVGHHNLI